MYLRSVLVKFEDGWPWPIGWPWPWWMTLTYFSRSWVSISTWKFAICICKHDNSTNISHIGSKLIPWMYLRSVLVKFEEGWPWPIFRGHGCRFQHENLLFVFVNMITRQILVTLAPNLYHGFISGVSWLSSKMDDLDLFFAVMGSISTWNQQFSLVNTITKQILVALGPNLYHGCISGVSWSSSKMDDLDLFLRSWGQFKHEN